MHRRYMTFMQVLLLAGVASSLVLPGGAQATTKCNLTVKVTGIRNTEGDIRVTLRSDPQTMVQSKVVDIDPKTMTATAVFKDVPQGTYDVAVIHDENKNGKLDFNEMGMPMEGYGHSNNPPKRMGPPNFDESKFTLAEPGKSIEIELIYWP